MSGKLLAIKPYVLIQNCKNVASHTIFFVSRFLHFCICVYYKKKKQKSDKFNIFKLLTCTILLISSMYNKCEMIFRTLHMSVYRI